MKASAILLMLVGVGLAVRFEDCGSSAKNISATTSGCDDGGDVCVLADGVIIPINTTFTPQSDYKTLSTKLTRQIGGETFQDLVVGDVCHNGTLKCPLKAGEQQLFSWVWFYKHDVDNAEGTKLDVKMELNADSGDVVVCQSFEVNIK